MELQALGNTAAARARKRTSERARECARGLEGESCVHARKRRDARRVAVVGRTGHDFEMFIEIHFQSGK